LTERRAVRLSPGAQVADATTTPAFSLGIAWDMYERCLCAHSTTMYSMKLSRIPEWHLRCESALGMCGACSGTLTPNAGRYRIADREYRADCFDISLWSSVRAMWSSIRDSSA
jgi:hypothetical protein